MCNLHVNGTFNVNGVGQYTTIISINAPYKPTNAYQSGQVNMTDNRAILYLDSHGLVVYNTANVGAYPVQWGVMYRCDY